MVTAPFSGLGLSSNENKQSYVYDVPVQLVWWTSSHSQRFSLTVCMPFMSPLFVDVPAASSDPPLPPETGQHGGAGGGEEAAADWDWLPAVSCYISFSSSLHNTRGYRADTKKKKKKTLANYNYRKIQTLERWRTKQQKKINTNKLKDCKKNSIGERPLAALQIWYIPP